MINETLEDRLNRNIEKTDDCWFWKGSVSKSGYGTLAYLCKYLYAHRAAYMTWVGEIPKGLNVCHHCDNKTCINPEHLWVGSQKENLHDMIRKGRQNFHLVTGMILNPNNTHWKNLTRDSNGRFVKT